MQPRCVRGSWSLFVSLLFSPRFGGCVYLPLSPRLQLVGCIRFLCLFLVVLLCPGQVWWPWPPSDSQISLPCLASRQLYRFRLCNLRAWSSIIHFTCLVFVSHHWLSWWQKADMWTSPKTFTIADPKAIAVWGKKNRSITQRLMEQNFMVMFWDRRVVI